MAPLPWVRKQPRPGVLQDAEGRCVSDEIQTADIADEAVCAKFAETIAMLLDNNDALSDELGSMLHKLVNYTPPALYIYGAGFKLLNTC